MKKFLLLLCIPLSVPALAMQQPIQPYDVKSTNAFKILMQKNLVHDKKPIEN